MNKSLREKAKIQKDLNESNRKAAELKKELDQRKNTEEAFKEHENGTFYAYNSARDSHRFKLFSSYPGYVDSYEKELCEGLKIKYPNEIKESKVLIFKLVDKWRYYCDVNFK